METWRSSGYKTCAKAYYTVDEKIALMNEEGHTSIQEI